MPYLGTNGHYILRPPSDRNAGTGIVCTICVTYVVQIKIIYSYTMHKNAQVLLRASVISKSLRLVFVTHTYIHIL